MQLLILQKSAASAILSRITLEFMRLLLQIKLHSVYDFITLDIAIHWSQLPAYGGSLFQEDSDQCLANYTIFNENHIDTDHAKQGVNCSKRDSTATDGTWTYETDGTVINCTDNTGEVFCERGPGSVTLYTDFGCCGWGPYLNGIYTCCIEGSCISIRVYQV